ncbi:SMI1/KNR4 family protein [Acinetobacter puyangensis]|uniref:SMI1-KNR4 cell-wall n=1 Tax=Acinetobacter puyangensis TaxID=1096779 RepID=A0A240EAS5_9GAMM|nr:SMI1/KNR4 family protein [Acinetobacter puyangensis]SNX45772.1 SMI1-KNR4 cell-wall [Acinetobacter puyangensis]
MYQIESKGYPISENDVIEFENLITLKLPHEYRIFLLQYNVCMIFPDCFDFLENNEKSDSRIRYFLGLNVHPRKEYYYSLYWYYDLMQRRIPKNFLAIAPDPFGNAILIHLTGGSIWFWDHELEADTEAGEEVSMDNISFIANSLDEFLNSLYELKLEDD